ncbi:MAG: hypothetical protein Q8O40_17095 [Chloroflexota bacterium]|nr:hypothetical protein [Chloroflexota bacterium]
MSCHGHTEGNDGSGRRKVPWLLVVGLALALGLGAVLLAKYGVSLKTLGIVALFAAHPLVHLVGMRRKPSPGAQGPQPVPEGEDRRVESHHH